MEAQLEARLGHVTGDELAANGLLMIRLSPDSNGRYGFIVKVGVALYEHAKKARLFLSL